jgi:hypothetical protein
LNVPEPVALTATISTPVGKTVVVEPRRLSPRATPDRVEDAAAQVPLVSEAKSLEKVVVTGMGATVVVSTEIVVEAMLMPVPAE